MKINARTKFLIISGFLLFCLVLIFKSKSTKIQSLDETLKPIFVKLIRGNRFSYITERDGTGKNVETPVMLYLDNKGQARSALAYKITQFCQKICPAGLLSDILAWNYGRADPFADVSDTNISILFISYKSSRDIQQNDILLLVDEKGTTIPLQESMGFDPGNRVHVMAWPIPSLLEGGGTFYLISESTKKKLFKLSIPK